MAEKMTEDYDIAVGGAGPSGMTAALLLARIGYRTALVSPPANLSDGRTTALLQASVTLYERLDLWDELEGQCAALRNMRMIDDTGRLIRAPEVTFESAELDLPAFGYNILNKDLNRTLETAVLACDKIDLIGGFASSYDFGDDTVAIALEDGRTIRARLCVAADGRNSRARDAAGIEVNSWAYPQSAMVLNLGHVYPHHDTSNEFHTPTGPFTLVPLKGRASSLVCVVRPEETKRLTDMSNEELALELERRAHSILGKFTVQTKPQTFPLSGLTAKKLAAKRLVLIGEAAHVFPPIGAQGLNLGLRDVSALVDILDKEDEPIADPGADTITQAYERARWQDIKSRTAAVDALNRSLLSDFLPVQLMRSAGLYAADRIGSLRRILMREGIAPGTRNGLPLPKAPSFPKMPKILRTPKRRSSGTGY